MSVNYAIILIAPLFDILVSKESPLHPLGVGGIESELSVLLFQIYEK